MSGSSEGARVEQEISAANTLAGTYVNESQNHQPSAAKYYNRGAGLPPVLMRSQKGEQGRIEWPYTQGWL